jgi:undecaprenol kinase
MDKQKDKGLPPPELDTSVIGTMRINPKPYKAAHNKDDIDRFKFAVAGLLFMLRREGSIRSLLITTLVIIPLLFWLNVEILHGVIVFMSLGLVWTVEALNSAVEAVVDLVTQDIHPMAKVAKDVAAAATLISTLIATITILTLVGPPLIERLRVLLRLS